MAFGFGNAGNSLGSGAAPANSNAGASQGPDLEVVSTESLGFLSIAGDAKIRLTSPWSQPPAQHASLLTLAPRKGLAAAGGPDGVVLASTDAIRKAFSGPADGDSEVRPFQPDLKLPMPTRICQMAFTADENYLVISAEQGGGLAVYDVQALLQGSTQAAFEIPTNGEALRALVPNPMPEKGELCAAVTDKGNLLVANLKERGFIPGPNGQVLKDQVSCAAWSTKGKQLVAGLGDGTIQQMTPEGTVKALIPRPPTLDPNYFVSFLAWLENDVFLAVHVSTVEQPPQSKYHLITRQGQNFTFQSMTDPVDPFGSDKIPHHTAARLKDFPPSLQDLLIFSSTATPDIGLMSRSKAPLSTDVDADKITNVFTTTELADDSKRATLPMGETLDSGLPIGTALDLSSKDPVYKPIPSDEMEQSAGPLPGYWVLNDEGVLSAWWVIYNDSIRAGTTYPQLAAAAADASTTPAAPAATQAPPANPFGTPSASAFGAPTSSSGSAFGAPASSSGAAFGGPSALGTKSSPWGAPSTGAGSSTSGTTFGSGAFGGGGGFGGGGAFGGGAPSATPTFGQPSFGSTSFGQSSGLGAKSSPWATAAGSSSTPAFGQSGFANTGASSGSAFGGTGGTSSTSGGFANFAKQGGFAAVGANGSNGGTSIFASGKPALSGNSMDTGGSTAFPPPSSKPAGTASGAFGSQPFKLMSSFQRDPNDKDDQTEEPASNKSMFGGGIASALEETSPAMSGVSGSLPMSTQSTTPTSTPAPSKFISQPSTAPSGAGIFGFPSKSGSSLFGAPSKIKAEEDDTPKSLKDIPHAPLPPESTSKASFPFGESLSSSPTSAGSTDAGKAPQETPLPSEPATSKSARAGQAAPPSQKTEKASEEPAMEAPLPPDPTTNKKMYDVKFGAIPGVKTESIFDKEVPKQTGLFKFPTNPPPVSDSEEDEDEDEEDDDDEHGEEEEEEDEDEDEEEEEEEEEDEDEESGDGEAATEAASEGSGVDVAKDMSPPSADKEKSPGFTPQSSFDGLGGSYSTISRPEPERTSLFGGLGQSVPQFPQPNPISPCSPSPIRGPVASRVADGDKSRSLSAPGMASQLLAGPQRSQSRFAPPIVSRESASPDPHVQQQRKARERKEAEEARLLVDEEDERTQELLRAEMQPTLELHEFIAHTGPAEAADNSIPAQVEAVYRDINAMIDTLGLNARSLANFLKGHSETFRHERRDKHDLSNPDDWVLGELEDLSRIISRDLIGELREACVAQPEDKISECQDLLRDLGRDRSKRNDLQKVILARFDPDQVSANRALPLTTEQAGRQGDLRRDLAHFTRLLAEAEEALTMLRTKIVAASSASGKGGPVPTLDAVVRTIAKMTAMAEKRSGDVDLLENRMRQLRFSSPSFDSSTRSREGSPFLGTPSSRKSLTSSLMFSPDRSLRESTPTPYRSSMRQSMSQSIGSIGGGMFAVRTTPRKKLSGFGDGEKTALKERRERRAAVLGKLRNAVEKRGATVVPVDATD